MQQPGELFIDLHTHSKYSDGLAGIEKLESMCLQRGIGMALTDHNEIRGSIRLVENGRIPTLPAVEVGTREGLEFLIYFERPEQLERFFVDDVEPYLWRRFMVRSSIPTLKCLMAAKEKGGYVSLAHPFAYGRKSLCRCKSPIGSRDHMLEKTLNLIDAYEIYNGGIDDRSNRRVETLAGQIDKRITVGSDAHWVSRVGTAGVAVRGDMESRATHLFDQVSGGDILWWKGDSTASTIASSLVIAAQHTAFFLMGRKGNS